MTKEWPHLLISCSQEKHQRQKSDKWQCECKYSSRLWLCYCVRRCVAHELYKSVSFNHAES